MRLRAAVLKPICCLAVSVAEAEGEASFVLKSQRLLFRGGGEGNM